MHFDWFDHAHHKYTQCKQKGFVSVLLVLVVLASAAVAGYLYFGKNLSQISLPTPKSLVTPTPANSNETASWKTYTNSKYYFAFNYPNSWIAEEDSGKQSRGVPLVFLRPKSLQVEDSSHGEITVFIYDNIKTVEEYASKLCDSPNDCVSTKDVKNIKIGSLEAFRITNIPGPLPSEEIVFKKGELVVAFHFNYQGESYNNYSNKESKQVFDQVLSTFKFIDKTPPPNTNPNLKTFNSEKLGISFTYLEKQGDETMGVMETGDKVYISSTRNKMTDGQFVEVFSKDTSENLEQAIKRAFLKDISSGDCFVVNTTSAYKTSNYPSSFEIAEISFPKDANSEEPWWAKSNKCPQGYSQSNGISYFLADSNHPNKFLFFSIGQYPILSDSNKTWQQTILFK